MRTAALSASGRAWAAPADVKSYQRLTTTIGATDG